MFFSRGSLGTVEFAFTDRHGGHSGGNYSSLNLGTSALGAMADSDDRRVVQRNRDTLAASFGAPFVITMAQVHGADVAYVDANTTETPVADAMFTDTAGLGLIVRAADCTPIVLADPAARLVGVVHAGREGLVRGVTLATVNAMRAHGATRIQAWIGPRACGSCYEVPEELADSVAAVAPAARTTTGRGTPGLDIGRGVAAQLESEDVQVIDLGEGACTITDDRFFSYRRQGKSSGRQGAIAMLRQAADR